MRIVSKKFCLRDAVFICFLNGKWWTFWGLREEIYKKTGTYYDHTSISASIREIRHQEHRVRYGLPTDMSIEVVEKRKLLERRGWEYKLSLTETEILKIKEKKNARRRI